MSEEQSTQENANNAPQEKLKASEYFKLGPVFSYWFRKKDPNRPTNFNLRMMHGINKISMLMFLIALIILIIRRLG